MSKAKQIHSILRGQQQLLLQQLHPGASALVTVSGSTSGSSLRLLPLRPLTTVANALNPSPRSIHTGSSFDSPANSAHGQNRPSSKKSSLHPTPQRQQQQQQQQQQQPQQQQHRQQQYQQQRYYHHHPLPASCRHRPLQQPLQPPLYRRRPRDPLSSTAAPSALFHTSTCLHSSASARVNAAAALSASSSSTASSTSPASSSASSNGTDSIPLGASGGGIGNAGQEPPGGGGGEGRSDGQGSEGAHVFAGQEANAHHTYAQGSTAWASELPWIDPYTQAAFDPPLPRPGAGAGAGVGTMSTMSGSSFFEQPFQATTRHNYVFSHGASGFAKNPNRTPVLTPEEDRAYFSVQVGEDSYFRRHDALGVADGVGGWCGTSGANPALYSRKLMHYAFLELEKYDNIEEEAFYDYFNVNPVEILERSYEQSARDAKKEGLIGSSTACIAILRDDELRIANLGDCGVSVIRKNEFIFRTEEQQHSFNFPYQLGTGSTDSPTDAQVFTVKVESGDIVVMGTDGIFDNLFDEDILEEVVRCVNGREAESNQNPFGTGTATTTKSKGGVGGLWSGLTSGAAKFASTSSSTIAAAITGKAHAPAPEVVNPESENADSTSEQDDGAENDKEDASNSCELSPLAAAAIAAAETSALPPSAALNALSPNSTSTAHAKYRRPIPEPNVISDALAKRAKSVSEDTRHHGSPFQSRAMQEGLYYQGGKQDDMSVLVAIIKVAEDSPDRR